MISFFISPFFAFYPRAVELDETWDYIGESSATP
jgi:hypothetical protein